MKRIWLISAMGALASGLLLVPAQAAPVSVVTGDLKIAAGENTGVEKVHRRGQRYRHFRRHRDHGYRTYWRRPGVHLYLGHSRHHRHHRHHRQFRRW